VGDTHLTTFDGLHYDFQAAGEYVLAEVPNEFTVQVRQASGAPTWPNAAVNKGVAVGMGRSRVVLYVEPARLEIDGTARALADGRSMVLAEDVQVRREGTDYFVSDKHGNRVRATLNTAWIDVAVMLGQTPSKVRGLLGNPGGDGRALETAAAALLADPMSFADLYGPFATSWRVQVKDSLFAREGRLQFAVPSRPFYAHDLPPEAASRARAICHKTGVTQADMLEDCVLDTVVLGVKAAAKAFVHPPPVLRTVVKPVFTGSAACAKGCAEE
jgi:hypothetical protein